MRQHFLVLLYGILLQIVAFTIAQQHVAPGVPPQHYQQPPQYQQAQQTQYQQQQQQQYQQPQQQYQQPQQQYQQPPQNQQYQAPNQQPPQQQHDGGHHHDHSNPQPVLSGNVQQERAHIAEHLEVPIDTSKMTEQELQFHYFKMHDADNNNKLDGSELIKSLIHWHDDKKDDKHGEAVPKPHGKVYTDEELEKVVDHLHETMDKDKDGYITYSEYRSHSN